MEIDGRDYNIAYVKQGRKGSATPIYAPGAMSNTLSWWRMSSIYP